MAKEINLQQLIDSTTEDDSNVVETNNIKPAEVEVTIPDKQPVIEEAVSVAEPEQKYVGVNATNTPPRSASISDLAKNLPGKPEVEEARPVIVDNAFKAMYDTIEEKKERYVNEVLPKRREQAEEAELDAEYNAMMNGEDNEETVEEVTVDSDEIEEEESTLSEVNTDVKFNNNKVETALDEEMNNLDQMIADFDKELDDDTKNEDVEATIESEDDEETAEETLERFKKSLAVIKPVKEDLDLSTFKILKTPPAAASTILSTLNNTKNIKTADWALLNSGVSITVSETSGPELDALSKKIQNSNNINGTISILKLIYNHIIDGNKPEFETWTKCIKYADLESLYFALYRACYADTNLIAISDEDGCKKTAIYNIPIDSMVKFKDDETKEKFNKIYQHDTTNYADKIEANLIAISDDLAISYTEPTLYNTLIQFAGLNKELIDKHGSMLETMAYIDQFFKIDRESKALIPLQYKVYPNNLTKTILSKLKVYSQVLSTLTTDQYDILITKLNSLVSNESEIEYIVPEVKCSECGEAISEHPAGSMLDLVFTRRQLAAITNL